MLARVSNLWRYPVKSLSGEQREWLDITMQGVAGDRRFAIRNADGKLASGKNTRRFFKLEGLLDFHSSCESDVPVISLPDGQTVGADDPDIHATLSQCLSQPVTLVTEAEIPHKDAAPVHLLTTASLEWLKESVPGAQVDERRFRPNLLIDTAGATRIEDAWLGKTLAIGDEVVLRITRTTERCAITVYPQPGLPFDARILKCIAQRADLNFGVYAEVLAPGRIRRGDIVAVEE